jgi:hypothetical protein
VTVVAVDPTQKASARGNRHQSPGISVGSVCYLTRDIKEHTSDDRRLSVNYHMFINVNPGALLVIG